MKTILIINSNREQNYYLKYMIEGLIEASIIIRESLSETLATNSELIKNASVVIIEYNIKGFKNYLELIANGSKVIQSIVTFNNSQEDDIQNLIITGPNTQKFNIEKGEIISFEKALITLLKFDHRINKKENYCRVKLDYFLKIENLICDAFIQISEEKYVKIINRHENFSSEDILKYKTKGITHLYIKENDYKIFINAMIREIQVQKHSQLPIKQGEKSIIPLSCIETVHEMVHKMGLSSQALTLTNESINQTLTLVKKAPILKLLKSTLGQGSYISELSLLTNYISCAICRESEWATSENYLRLSLASFFQNISLDSDDHAKITNINSSEFLNFMSKTKKTIIDHPNKSCELISAIAGLPLGVDKIIKNHHEKYDGSGFPRGIDHSKHEPLTVMIILSIELADILFEQGFNRDIILEVIENMEQNYTKSFYPKVVSALKKAFSVPLLDYQESADY